MSVKSVCTICDKFIKDVSNPNEIRQLTGKEICSDCGDRVKGIIGELENKQKEHIQKLSVAHQAMMAKYRKLQQAATSNTEAVNGMYGVAQRELKSVLQEILDR